MLLILTRTLSYHAIDTVITFEVIAETRQFYLTYHLNLTENLDCRKNSFTFHVKLEKHLKEFSPVQHYHKWEKFSKLLLAIEIKYQKVKTSHRPVCVQDSTGNTKHLQI